jgi:preprotein translocase subunit SecB
VQHKNVKTQNSPLQCQVSSLNSLSIKEFTPRNDVKNPFSMFDYAIDLNFDILENASETNKFIVRIEININNKGKKLPGYVISLKVDYLFQITDDKLNDDAVINLKTVSAISITIAKLRSDLERITQPYKFGTYSLPYIDIQDLLVKKQALINSKSK